MKAAPEADRAVGMEEYSTKSQPCSASLRAWPEDFRVEEVISLDGLRADWTPGAYPVYRVQKRMIDTFHLEQQLASELKSRVTFGGLKDKRAVAAQYFTPSSSRSLRPDTVSGEAYSGVRVGFLPHPLGRGSVEGNRFTIMLRDCCPGMLEVAREVLRAAGDRRVPNYFGLQRFGGGGALTHGVGKALVTRRFEDAVSLMLFQERPRDTAEAKEARAAMAAGRMQEGVARLPRGQDVEAKVARWLIRRPGDWVGALRAVPIRLRRLYVHAYQSYIFNRALSLALRKGMDVSGYEPGDNWCEVSADGLRTSRIMGVRDPLGRNPVPVAQIPGFAFRDYGSRFDALTVEVLEEERVRPGDFYVEAMQEVSAEGGFRRPHLATAEANASESDEGVAVSFTLGRGGYATVLVREMVKPDDPISMGFA